MNIWRQFDSAAERLAWAFGTKHRCKKTFFTFFLFLSRFFTF